VYQSKAEQGALILPGIFAMQDWVRAEYRKRYCDKSGQLIAKINIDRLRLALQKVRPTEKQAITEALKQ
jgi:hypothetical protein